ncbi:hypothetical protein [Aeromicrobium sp.]|uniref:hypothetical protein n=1 Tax=Aeromicrobium sp. TaxID=1871063 RepID=UPI0019B3BCC3|nr:hypothetical protein [Aeromicrobium sp.]MBC7633923.1 hypothetical protein [Aeromicrobium sp.]
MSEASLVVHQGSLDEMTAAMTQAHDTITTQVQSALDKVNAEIAAWSPATTSRAAEMNHQQKLRDGVERLTAALEKVRAALDTVAESARDTEVKNVAIVD